MLEELVMQANVCRTKSSFLRSDKSIARKSLELMSYSSVFEVLLEQFSSVIDNQVYLLRFAWGVGSVEIFVVKYCLSEKLVKRLVRFKRATV